jgi:phosphonopyruvate decarboxylase
LKLLDIKFSILSNFSDLKKIKKLYNYAKNKKRPVAFLIKNKTLVLEKERANNKSVNYLTREIVVNELLCKINKNTRIISATGYTSRELYQIRKNKNYKKGKDFYMVGGMGHSSMLSLGYSLNTKNQVICLDGDGSLLMHLGSLISTGLKSKSNFKHILLNNGSHESVGGQKIDTLKVDFEKISKGFGYKNYFFANNQPSLINCLGKFLRLKGPSFFEIHIDQYIIKNLSRPGNLERIKQDFSKS